MSERRDTFSEVVSKASTVKVRNVMNPLLWLNAVGVPVFVLGAFALRSEAVLSAAMTMGALGIPVWTLVEYSLFARRDPQRLHSEEYLLAQQRLMIQSKSSREPIDANTIPAGANPELIEYQTEPIPIPLPEKLKALPSSQETDDER